MIPSRAVFCWMGRALPWPYVFALRSAALRGGLDRVLLYHTDPIEDRTVRSAIDDTPGLECVCLDAEALLEEASGRGTELVDLYRRLPGAVGRSNMLRAALLARDGGIYLDMDTVTVASLRPLLGVRQLVGLERIVHPRFVRASWNPALRLKSVGLSGIRSLLRRIPHGYRYFRAVEHWYYCAINGAILGSVAGGELVTRYLDAMLELPRARQTAKHGVGTHLLQDQVAAYEGDDLTIHPPEVFYPLPPEISEHWFRITSSVDLDAVFDSQTRVAHWYASVRTKPILPRIDPDYVRRHAGRQLYSTLVEPMLP